jgi:hypothetical protein
VKRGRPGAIIAPSQFENQILQQLYVPFRQDEPGADISDVETSLSDVSTSGMTTDRRSEWPSLHLSVVLPVVVACLDSSKDLARSKHATSFTI